MCLKIIKFDDVDTYWGDVWYNHHVFKSWGGEIVSNENEACGKAEDTELTYPNYLIFINDSGCNMSMK